LLPLAAAAAATAQQCMLPVTVLQLFNAAAAAVCCTSAQYAVASGLLTCQDVVEQGGLAAAQEASDDSHGQLQQQQQQQCLQQACSQLPEEVLLCLPCLLACRNICSCDADCLWSVSRIQLYKQDGAHNNVLYLCPSEMQPAARLQGYAAAPALGSAATYILLTKSIGKTPLHDYDHQPLGSSLLS
jgi:hypothetical protein